MKKTLAKSQKPIIATTLSGLFIHSGPWKTAHLRWYEIMAEKLKDHSIIEPANREDYFKTIDEVMKRLYPDKKEKERTKIARELFFETVLHNIKKDPSVKNQDIIDYFQSLKNDYRIALITTNTYSALINILDIINLPIDFFGIIETSELEEKDDKKAVFDRFIKKYSKPVLYIGGDRKDSYDYCKKNKIQAIFANLENQEDIGGVITVHNLNELKIEAEKFI